MPIHSASQVPPPPRFPSQEAKRLILSFSPGQKNLWYVGIGMSAFGLLFSLPFNSGLIPDITIDLEAKRTQATVVEAKVDESVKVNDKHPVVVVFRYVASDDREYRSSCPLFDSAVIAQAQPGSRVEIEYAAKRPEWARLRGQTRNWIGYWGIVFLAFPISGLWMIWYAWSRRRARRRAYLAGEAITGVILGLRKNESTQVNGRHLWILTWEFTLQGAPYQGTLVSLNKSDFGEYREGEGVAVLYDPAQPSANTIYMP